MIPRPPLTPASPTGRFRSLRTRITVWYGAIIASCLLTYSIAVGLSFTAHVEAELDRGVHEDLELAARAVVVDENGRLSWPGWLLGEQVKEEEGGGHWAEVWSANGERLLATGTLAPLDLGPPDPSQLQHRARTVKLPSGSLRILSERVTFGGSDVTVRAVLSEAGALKQVHSLWTELAALSLTVLALGGLGGHLLARRSLGPLARMADHARRITAKQPHERLPPEDSTAELSQLRDAFNDTLARLEHSFEQLRRFTADASHELRTPLTALRSVGEVGLRQARTGEEYREVIGTMLEEVDRLSRLADELLTIARAESGEPHLHVELVDLTALAYEVTGHLGVLAEERQQTLEVRANGPLTVKGDRLGLRQALLNLVDNAIKYSPEGKRVSVQVGTGARSAFVEVRDEGPGIPAEHRERIFERFYRVDAGRSRETGGTGLGLSLVKATAEAHGGSVELETNECQGSTFRFVLPRSAP